MPTYEFKCDEHGVFEQEFSIESMPQEATCVCGSKGPKVISKFGNISTSDDPSFSSSKQPWSGRHEYQGFDPDNHGWAEKPKHSKSDWEYE